MKLKLLNGRVCTKNCIPCLIHWKKPSRSKIQFRCKQLLEPIWRADVVFEEFPVFGTRMKVDIVNVTRHIAIEVQGRQHDKLVPYFHGDKYGWGDSIDRDEKKAQWLELNGFRLVEVIEADLESFTTLYKRVYPDES